MWRRAWDKAGGFLLVTAFVIVLLGGITLLERC